MVSYADAITEGFQGVVFSSATAGNVYEDIMWVSGDPLPLKHELDTYILTQQRTLTWKNIQSERDRRKAFGAPIGPHWFHSDDTSRIQYIGLLMYGANMPTGIMWKTMAGTLVEMTPTLAQQIFGTIASRDTSIFTIAEQHRSQLNLSTTPSTYDYLTGTPSWPLTYGE